MAWNNVRRTIRATNALRSGGNPDNPPEQSKGFQKKRRTDNLPPADPRPAPLHSNSAPPRGEPYNEAVTHGYPPAAQQWPPREDPTAYPYSPGIYPPPQDNDSPYNTQEHHVPRHNRFPSSQVGTSDPSMGPASQSGYQEQDRQPQYSTHQDYDSSYYQNPDPYGSSSSSRSGPNQDYSGQSYQGPPPSTDMNPRAYNQGQSGYGPASYDQGQGYPQYRQPSHSGSHPPSRATSATANLPYPHGVPPNSGYNSYNGSGNYNGGDNYNGGNNYNGGGDYDQRPYR